MTELCAPDNAFRHTFQTQSCFPNIEMGSGNANKAAVYTNPGTTETEVLSLAIPEPGPGQILVKM